MHSQKTIIAVKVNGRVLRETGDTVSLPFGSEFALLVRNLNSVRSQVSISIDGDDVTDGTRLIIEPNSSIELGRYVRNRNFTSGNRFRFIERSTSIEEHRGIGIDDGIIRVEAWKELVRPEVPVPNYTYYNQWIPYPYQYPWGPYWLNGGLTGTITRGSSYGDVNITNSAINTNFTANSLGNSSPAANMVSCNFVQSDATARSDAGITVPGSESTQPFHHAAGFSLEDQSTVIVLRLCGEVGNRAVVTPVTVDLKPKCTTCGRLNRAVNKFCSNCGTALVLL